MAKPLVTHVLWTLGRGGAERMVFDLARSLPEAGFEAQVLAAGGDGPMAEEFREAGIPLLINPDGGKVSGRSAVRFLRIALRDRRPSLFHSHLTPVWAGVAARTAFMRPWIATAHGFEPGLPLAARIGRRLAYRSADHVVCVSEAVRRALLRMYGFSPGHSSVISPGVDLKRFTPREAHLAGDVPTLVTVGRLAPEKGLDVLFRALSEVSRPWKLIVVGGGPEYARLQHLAESLGLLPRIRFMGPVSDPAPFLHEADLFCFPSHHEGQGMALLEAAAARVPSVSSDLPALREAFGPDAMSYAKPGDVTGWKLAIEQALSRYPEALDRAGKAEAIVEKRYSLEVMLAKHVELYKSLLRV